MELRRIPNLVPDNELYHHGIKGQRWGIRRYQNEDGTLTAAGKSRYAKQQNRYAVKQRKENLKNRRSLSDSQLNSNIQRLQNEKRFKELTEDDLRPAKRFCTDALKKIGSNVITSVVTGATMYAINAAITKEVDPIKFAKFVAPEPKKK